jgi:hypothetical protein
MNGPLGQDYWMAPKVVLQHFLLTSLEGGSSSCGALEIPLRHVVDT